jgi:hypothetical protein
MKKSLLLAACCSLTLLGAARADLTIVQKVEGGGQNMESTTKFKENKTRVDAGPGTSIIMDLKTGDIVNVMQAQKSYMKIPGAMAQQAMDSMKQMQASQGAAKPELTPTGKKETISGYASEEYSTTIAGAKMHFWLTKALPDYQSALKQMSAAFSQGPMAAMMQGLGLDIGALPGFPMRISQDADGGQTMTSTVVSVNTKPVADSEFAIPAGYKEITMPNLTPAGANGQ